MISQPHKLQFRQCKLVISGYYQLSQTGTPIKFLLIQSNMQTLLSQSHLKPIDGVVQEINTDKEPTKYKMNFKTSLSKYCHTKASRKQNIHFKCVPYYCLLADNISKCMRFRLKLKTTVEAYEENRGFSKLISAFRGLLKILMQKI